MTERAPVILDTAFGHGEHFLAALARWRASGADRLHYLAQLPALPPAQVLPPMLRADWPPDLPGQHRLTLENGRITLDLLVGPAEEGLGEIVARVDQFIVPAPLAYPRALQRLAAPDASLRLRAADADLRAWRAAGFSWDGGGQGGADGWLHGRYTSRKPQPARRQPGRRSAIVIGAGVAGSAACERLAARGWDVTLIERHAEPAQEASGNRAGIFMPLLSRDDNIPTRLTRAAFLYALRTWQRLGGLDPSGAPGRMRGQQCGVLQLARDAAHAQLQEELVRAGGYPPQFVRWLDAAAAGRMLGAPTPYGAWHFALGGWATPATVCRAMLAACGPRLRRLFHAEAMRLARDGDDWQVLDAQGRVLAAAPTVIVASGAGAGALAQSAPLPLYAMRGQVTHIDQHDFPALPLVVCREAYMTPPVDGIVSVGATYDSDDGRALRQASQDENLQRAGEMLGRPCGALPLAGRVGFRCMAPDRLPLVGALPDYAAAGAAERLRALPRHTGLYSLLGYASRGLIWAPLAAELLACQLEDEPLPLPATLADALDPGRFLLKQRRQQVAL